MEIYKVWFRLQKLLEKKLTYFLLILSVILISYGQMLFMGVWKDDNAVFFKFYHIDAPAGYLGKGLLGEGPYKFTVAPYYFVYKIFGVENLFPYYLLTLFFYFIAALSVYKLFSILINEEGGKLAGFLFACGYIASEGFIWLASSMIQSVSIILVSFTVSSYFLFCKSRKIYFYFASILFFLITLYITPVRVHYLFLLIFFLDLIYLLTKFKFNKIPFFILRTIPFFVIFYFFYIASADSRTFLFKDFLINLIHGEYFNLFSFFGSLGNLIIPDVQLRILANHLSTTTHFPYKLFGFELLIILFVIFLIQFSFIKSKQVNLILVIYFLLSLIEILFSYKIATNIKIGGNIYEILAVFIGIFFLSTIAVIIFLVGERNKKLLLINISWIVFNLLAYSTYLPTNLYATTDRYLAHSFVPLIGIWSSVVLVEKRKLKIILFGFVITLCLVCIYNSVLYQHNILKSRSFPVNKFYSDLRSDLPKIAKGDLLYFDIKDDARAQFDSAFSVGQMPDETAIAWRYGLDRYDFKIFTEFEKFEEEIKQNNVEMQKIHTFYYSKSGLVDTSVLVRNKLYTKNENEKVSFNIYNTNQNEILLNFSKPLVSVVPLEVSFDVKARYLDSSELNFPIISNNSSSDNKIYHENELRKLAFAYKNYKIDFANQSEVKTDTEWRDRTKNNLVDMDPDTIWQGDRIAWQSSKELINIDLKKTENIDRLIWINGFPNNTPIEYKVYVSTDEVNWLEVQNVKTNSRIDDKLPQTVYFPAHNVRYIKMQVTKTFNDDSPAIAEIYVLPAIFDQLDVRDAENFLQNPYLNVYDSNTYNETLKNSGYLGYANINWISDKYMNWHSTNSSRVRILYDSNLHSVSVHIPAGGTNISKLLISDIQVPGDVQISNVHVRYEGISD